MGSIPHDAPGGKGTDRSGDQVNPTSERGGFLTKVAGRLQFLELATRLGLAWDSGGGYACPTGHASESGSCCRAYTDHAYCFRCHTYFGHVQLVELIRGCTREEALPVLSDLSGVLLPEGAGIDSGVSAAAEERADVVAARTQFARIAHERLTATDRQYLGERGLESATIDRFVLGSAVPGLVDVMISDGWPAGMLVRAGIAVRNGSGIHQFILNRITMPTVTADGQVVDITARTTVDDGAVPKYTRLPVRSDRHPEVSQHVPVGIMFGILSIMEDAERLLVVEGPFDAMILAQRGLAVVALQSNRITPEQATCILEHIGRRTQVVAIPDQDAPGHDGAIATGKALLPKRIEIAIARIPPGGGDVNLDPADFFKDMDSSGIDKFLKDETIGLLRVLASRHGFSNLSAYQAMEAAKNLAEELFQILDLEGALLALDSIVWAHFGGLSRGRHRRQLDEHVRGLAATREAERQLAQEDSMSPEEREAALAFLRDPDLVRRIADDLELTGYIGEEENKLLLYVVASSRKMRSPLSCNLLSPSSSGKTALIDKVVQCMPPSEVFRITRATPRALYHMPPGSLRHRWLILEERDGIEEEGDYPIRSLQSEGKLTLLIPYKDPATGEIISVEKEVEGPVAFSDSTTAMTIEEQNATRGFSLHVDITQEQTLRIHRYQAESVTSKGRRRLCQVAKLRKLHQNAQRLLKPEIEVDVPFAGLVEFPSYLVRTRRDFLRFLQLVQAVTFLHQYQRPVMTDAVGGENVEYLEATVADYTVAYEIAKRAILSAVDDLNAHARDILQKTVEWLHKRAQREGEKAWDIQFSRRHLREKLGIDGRALEKYVPNLHHRYFRIVKGGRGQTYVYTLASEEVANECQPDLGLTTPDELAARIASQTDAATSATSSDHPQEANSAPAQELGALPHPLPGKQGEGDGARRDDRQDIDPVDGHEEQEEEEEEDEEEEG